MFKLVIYYQNWIHVQFVAQTWQPGLSSNVALMYKLAGVSRPTHPSSHKRKIIYLFLNWHCPNKLCKKKWNMKSCFHKNMKPNAHCHAIVLAHIKYKIYNDNKWLTQLRVNFVIRMQRTYFIFSNSSSKHLFSSRRVTAACFAAICKFTQKIYTMMVIK